MKNTILLFGILCILISCNPKEVFAPLNTITINNNSNRDLLYTIKTKDIKRKLTLGRGFHYEMNGIRYNKILQSRTANLKPNESFVLIQVERHDEISLIDLIKNVIDEFIVTDNKNNVIFKLEDIKNANIEIKEPNVNNWIINNIFIK